jgi:hypothetical protein
MLSHTAQHVGLIRMTIAAVLGSQQDGRWVFSGSASHVAMPVLLLLQACIGCFGG